MSIAKNSPCTINAATRALERVANEMRAAESRFADDPETQVVLSKWREELQKVQCDVAGEITALREALGGVPNGRIGMAGFIRRMMPYLPDQFWRDSAEEMARACERALNLG